MPQSLNTHSVVSTASCPISFTYGRRMKLTVEGVRKGAHIPSVTGNVSINATIIETLIPLFQLDHVSYHFIWPQDETDFRKCVGTTVFQQSTTMENQPNT